MSDNLESIICPACNGEMTKIYVPEAQLFVDICDNCGGIFFDKSEFEKFTVERTSINAIKNITDEEVYNSIDEKRIRLCPKCNLAMVQTHNGINNDFKIDKCPACGGVFLDNKELEKIRGEF